MNDSSRPKHLPPGLTATVGIVEGILGRVVADAEGEALYDVVEGVRREMVAFREAGDEEEREAALDRAAERLAGLSIGEKTALARAYTLYLQLVNVCENAYRTHRLRERRQESGLAVGVTGSEAGAEGASARAELTFVLTAHPTESRSPENIDLLRRVQDHVVESLDRGRPLDRREIENLIHLAWRVGTHPREKPSVEDEANHLFSLLTDSILAEVIALARAGHRILFRTWVGGDKDGHPGVGPEQTQAALQRARTRLLAFIEASLLGAVRAHVDLMNLGALETAAADVEPGRSGIATGGPDHGAPLSDLEDALSGLEDALFELETVSDGDGGRLEALRRAATAFQAAYRERFGIEHPALGSLEILLDIFPALVVPLELREERGRFAADEPIAGMMRRLKEIASGGRIDGYARAVVVSMTLEAEDLLEAQRLADDVFGEAGIPVVPLFELPHVLGRAPAILEEAWTDERFRAAIRARGCVEVMLGYSDTAKRMGMLASRVALHDAMRRIGEWAESENVTPLFFHGHGGSVGRGGGRIEDLAATWPPRARTPYKYTLQGEMVERTLATPEILRSLVDKVAEVQGNPPAYADVGPLARDLAEGSRAAFEARIGSEPFRRLLEVATPYGRLQELTIGSRPARRGDGGLEELRAIPWVLCWTQTRLLLHAWLGIGQAWRELREAAAERSSRPDLDQRLAEAREEDPLFRSYARLLSFTMAKTEPSIWHRYRRVLAPGARGAKPSPERGASERGAGDSSAEMAAGALEQLASQLDEDYDAALDLACRAIGTGTLLPERPWLAESIRYRAPMIHPLNLLQIELLAREEWSEDDVRLFRETVTGIAAGMLTTG